MKEMIIVDGRRYFYTDGVIRKQITKKQADAIFQQWLADKRQIKRQWAMGGRVTQCWVE